MEAALLRRMLREGEPSTCTMMQNKRMHAIIIIGIRGCAQQTRQRVPVSIARLAPESCVSGVRSGIYPLGGHRGAKGHVLLVLLCLGPSAVAFITHATATARMLTWRDFEGESISLSLPHSRFMALPGRGLSASGSCWGEPKREEEHACSFTRASSLSICTPI